MLHSHESFHPLKGMQPGWPLLLRTSSLKNITLLPSYCALGVVVGNDGDMAVATALSFDTPNSLLEDVSLPVSTENNESFQERVSR